MNTKKAAGVYRRGEMILMLPMNVTTMGVGISGEPVLTMEGASAETIGQQLQKTLEESGKIVLHPEIWPRGGFDYVLKAAGVRSYKEFMRGARYVSAAVVDGKYVLQPTKNGGTSGDRKGFQGLAESRDREIVTRSEEELGRAVVAALDDSE